VIAGSSGFLGQHLVTALRSSGHEVTRLVRRPAQAADEVSWDPYADVVDVDLLAGADAVVNVAGSPTLGNPWSGRWARNLHDSRVATTGCLARALAQVASGRAAPVFVAGNAVGWYGDHGTTVITEDSPSLGDSFMTQVCRDWEAATHPATDAGIRVVRLHTAPVIDRTSAPLKQMLPAFRLGLGARIGSGQQYFPVVSLRDWVGAASYLIESDKAEGPYNLAAPVAPTNAEFTQALADAVGRKARLAAPAPVLGRAAGRLAPEILGSQRIEPRRLLDSGHRFLDEDVRDVVATALGRR